MKTATASTRGTRRDKKSAKRGGARKKATARRRPGAGRTPAARRPTRRAAPTSTWVVVPDPSAPEGPGIEVAVPSRGRKEGAVSDRAAAEAAKQVSVLEEHGRISRSAGPLGPGQTHAIETGARGKRRLVRKRFSAT